MTYESTTPTLLWSKLYLSEKNISYVLFVWGLLKDLFADLLVSMRFHFQNICFSNYLP